VVKVFLGVFCNISSSRLARHIHTHITLEDGSASAKSQIRKLWNLFQW